MRQMRSRSCTTDSQTATGLRDTLSHKMLASSTRKKKKMGGLKTADVNV